jgi:NADH-quinone oxidoreductase subunit I
MIGSGIAKGMATTLKHFFGKKYTIQYPEERAPLPVGFRGLPRLLYDGDDPTNYRCVACRICENACPVDVIHIDTHRGENRKMVLDRFDLEAGGCVFCGLCVEACPFEALTMMHGFELAAYDRSQLLWTKEMLAIKATERTLADMERIHGPKEKEEKKEPPAKAPETAPAKTMAAAVPGSTGAERSASIASAEPAPPRAEVDTPPEGNGHSPEPGAPPGPADSPSQAPGPAPERDPAASRQN